MLNALNHRKVDRIPIDLGGTQNSTMCRGAYEHFKAFLGVDAPTREMHRAGETVIMDEAVLCRLPVDTRPLFVNPPTRSRVRWLDGRNFVSDWGVTYRRPEDRPQYDIVAHPLAEATIEDLDTYDWPDVEDPGRYAGLRDKARSLHEDTEYAVCGSIRFTVLFDACWMLRGMQRFLMDLLLDPEFALALMERVAQIQFRQTHLFLHEVGEYIDVIMIADDMGIQSGLLLRPKLYRQMVKPYHQRYVRHIKERTDAKVVMHTCGGVAELVEDYIEIGVDALNPMQVSAVGMSTEGLKQRFGGRMAFWGGIDTQRILPQSVF